MTRVISALVATAAVLATPVVGQERTRSPQYSGEAVDNCYQWSVGFEHVNCARRPLPGSGLMAQVYTLTDGSFRTLTQDPAIQSTEETEESAEEKPAFETVQSENDKAETETTEAEVEEDPRLAVEDPLPDATDLPKGAGPATADPSAELLLPPVIMTQPGRTELVPTATGHLNRIETPFSDPVARAAARDGDTLDLQFDQNFIYASVTSPVTLFIHQRGHPDPAIAVSLIPQRIAPRQVRLALPAMQLVEAEKNNKTASQKPKAAPAAATTRTPKANSRGVTRNQPGGKPGQTLAGYIQTFAKGRVPKGFTQISAQGYNPASFCKRISGVTYSFAQGAAVVSNDYIIIRGLASANRAVELDERDCALNSQTLAVAFSPRTKIGPRQPTDFFVLLRKQQAAVKPAGKN